MIEYNEPFVTYKHDMFTSKICKTCYNEGGGGGGGILTVELFQN